MIFNAFRKAGSISLILGFHPVDDFQRILAVCGMTTDTRDGATSTRTIEFSKAATSKSGPIYHLADNLSHGCCAPLC